MMSLFRWKYRYCKARMVAFVNGDLSLRARRRIAHYIDECSKCDDLYTQERRMAQELQDRLHRTKAPDVMQVTRMWSAIQAEMTPVSADKSRSVPYYYQRTRYAVAMMVMVLTMAVTIILGNSSASLAAETTLPEPVNRYTLATTTSPDDNVLVAAATAEPGSTDAVTLSGLNLTLEATPRPVLAPDEN